VAELSSQFVKQGDTTDETDLNEKIASIEKFSDSCMSEMNGIFAKVDERRMVCKKNIKIYDYPLPLVGFL
jgi:hypothetical protein